MTESSQQETKKKKKEGEEEGFHLNAFNKVGIRGT